MEGNLSMRISQPEEDAAPRQREVYRRVRRWRSILRESHHLEVQNMMLELTHHASLVDTQACLADLRAFATDIVVS